MLNRSGNGETRCSALPIPKWAQRGDRGDPGPRSSQRGIASHARRPDQGRRLDRGERASAASCAGLRRLRLRDCRCADAFVLPDVQRLRLAAAGQRRGTPIIGGGGAAVMSGGAHRDEAPRQRGDPRGAARFPDEPIAFFCECGDQRCYRAVWLTGPAYDQARAAPEWLALVPGHLAVEERAKAVVYSAAAPATRERGGRIIVGVND